MTTSLQSRKAAESSVELHPLISSRWSTRAFDPNYEMTNDQLVALLEAARWAPSASNSQPWRFVVGRRGDATFNAIFEMLMPGNQRWAGNSSALIVMVAEMQDQDGHPRSHALYDLGLAASQLTIQAHAEGLYVHQMGGFHADVMKEHFELKNGYEPVAVIAVGELDVHLELPEPFKAREDAPRNRLSLNELILGGSDAN